MGCLFICLLSSFINIIDVRHCMNRLYYFVWISIISFSLNYRITIHSNGTLQINDVFETDEGFYHCNGIRSESAEVPQSYTAELKLACKFLIALNDFNIIRNIFFSYWTFLIYIIWTSASRKLSESCGWRIWISIDMFRAQEFPTCEKVVGES